MWFYKREKSIEYHLELSLSTFNLHYFISFKLKTWENDTPNLDNWTTFLFFDMIQFDVLFSWKVVFGEL